MKLESYLGLRYLKSVRDRSFFSLVTWISVIGIAFGVGALLVVLSVMTGFHDELSRVLSGVNAHLLVRHRTGKFFLLQEAEPALDRFQQEIALKIPIVYSEAMLVKEGRVSGVAIEGVESEKISSMDMIRRSLIAGDLKFEQSGGIIVGSRLAEKLKLSVGDEVKLVHFSLEKGRGEWSQRITKMRVGGIFRCGMYDFDAKYAFVSLQKAQKLLDLGQKINGVKIWLANRERAPLLAEAISRLLPEKLGAIDWLLLNRSLFEVISIEKRVLAIILLCIVLVAACNLISSLTMIVVRRRGDIAILKTMGASRQRILGIFVIQGCLMGGVGTAAGIFLGLLLSWVIRHVDIVSLPADIYFFSRLPSLVRSEDILLVGVISLAISFIATLYPAWRAARVWPVEGLREAG
ncbi:MAG: ABC transporter permease [Deltaproteobacteria bacterium]|nr:ABC transporter permease [Deltaproteobacteria bacterium]